MTSVRDSLWLVIIDGNRVRTILGKQPRFDDDSRGAPEAVRVVRVPHAAVTHALHLADGDVGRLRLEDDGSVTVANATRTRAREARHYGAPW